VSCIFKTDPSPVLEQAVQLQKKAHKAQDLEMENRQLRDRLDEYTNEFAEVKNQGNKYLICVSFSVKKINCLERYLSRH